MTCAQGLLRLLWGGPKLECYGTERYRMIRSKSFETQEVREIGRKEEGTLRGFPILWMEIIENIFQMEGKECKN